MQSKSAGQVVNNLTLHKFAQSEEDFLAICRCDCILIKVERNIFSNLEELKEKKRKELIASHLMNVFPIIAKNYSLGKITERSIDAANECEVIKG